MHRTRVTSASAIRKLRTKREASRQDKREQRGIFARIAQSSRDPPLGIIRYRRNDSRHEMRERIARRLEICPRRRGSARRTFARELSSRGRNAGAEKSFPTRASLPREEVSGSVVSYTSTSLRERHPRVSSRVTAVKPAYAHMHASAAAHLCILCIHAWEINTRTR